MTTLNIHNETTIKAKGIHTQSTAKPVICIDTGEVFASITDAAEHFGVTNGNISHAVRGIQKTCKGMRFCLLSRATENLDVLTGQIRTLNADAEDARKWREYQEAIHKAEEDRIRAEQERIAAIQERKERKAKLEAKVDRRRRIIERLESELQRARERLNDTLVELDALCAEEENESEVSVA